jgi:CubicO group peptidase (beta-lactamase class C family)
MIRRRLLPSFAIVIALSLSVVAQELPVTKPEFVGLSSKRLQRLSNAVDKSISDGRIAGGVTLVVRRGKVAWFQAQGMSDRETHKPMRKDSIFRICSMSKPITTVAAMMLYEEGAFLLDDPVSKYLPEFKDMKVLVKSADGKTDTVAAKHPITIRDLMRHTSGLTYNWNTDLGPIYKQLNATHGIIQYDATIADNIKALASAPLLNQPGEKFEYSLSVDVLGRLVEVLSGMPLDQFFQARIFQPLGMKDTNFFVPEKDVNRIATAYTYYAGKGLAPFPDTPIVEGPFSYSADYPYKGPRKLFSGGAGLVSTPMDYARFAQMLLNNGELNGKRLLSRKTVELMSHDQLGKIDPEMGFGLGFGVDGVKAPLSEMGTPGQFNWGGFFYTTFNIDPKEKMIVIFMGQLHPTGGLHLDREVRVLAYQAIID